MASPATSGSLEPAREAAHSMSTLAADFLQQVREIASAAQKMLNPSETADTNGHSK